MAATAPLAILLLLFPLGRWQWLRDIARIIDQILVSLFRHAPAGAVMLVSVLAGVGEELLFRGVLQDGLALVSGPWIALAAASMLFGLAHAITPGYFLVATVMGLYLGLLYLQSGNLLIPIVVHALYDWIAIHYYLWRRRRAAD